jgi:hypothetical protein
MSFARDLVFQLDCVGEVGRRPRHLPERDSEIRGARSGDRLIEALYGVVE